MRKGLWLQYLRHAIPGKDWSKLTENENESNYRPLISMPPPPVAAPIASCRIERMILDVKLGVNSQTVKSQIYFSSYFVSIRIFPNDAFETKSKRQSPPNLSWMYVNISIVKNCISILIETSILRWLK